jgi:hypothetical protein
MPQLKWCFSHILGQLDLDQIGSGVYHPKFSGESGFEVKHIILHQWHMQFCVPATFRDNRTLTKLNTWFCILSKCHLWRYIDDHIWDFIIICLLGTCLWVITLSWKFQSQWDIIHSIWTLDGIHPVMKEIPMIIKWMANNKTEVKPLDETVASYPVHKLFSITRCSLGVSKMTTNKSPSKVMITRRSWNNQACTSQSLLFVH